MAGSTLIGPLNATNQRHWAELCAQVAFTGFLFLIFVGLEPFALHDGLEGDVNLTGGGDTARQIIYLTACVIIVGLALRLRGERVLNSFPLTLVVLLTWCLVSVSWAIETGISARRLILTIILVASVFCGVDMLGTRRALLSLRLVLIVLMIVNLVSVFIVPQAVHLAYEVEADLTGNWRGLHPHKNIAGPIAALAALLFYHYGLTTRRKLDWVLFLVSVIFLYGTQCKTALGFLVVSVLLSTLFRIMGETGLGQRVFRVLFAGALVGVMILLFFAYDEVEDVLSDPEAFTGRMAAWQTVVNYLRDNWILGSGFGSFWQIGDLSPVNSVAAAKWVLMVAHSHNGYLEIFVATGIVGFCIGFVTLVIIPFVTILNPNHNDIQLQSLLLSFLLFIILANFLESIFLDRDHPEWVVYLIVLAIMHRMPEKASAVEGYQLCTTSSTMLS